VLTALLSILKWADGLAAANASTAGAGNRLKRTSTGGYERLPAPPAVSFNVVLDERQHGTQSLLHSGLSRHQGVCGSVLCSPDADTCVAARSSPPQTCGRSPFSTMELQRLRL
jgi:hypothetical protein